MDTAHRRMEIVSILAAKGHVSTRTGWTLYVTKFRTKNFLGIFQKMHFLAQANYFFFASLQIKAYIQNQLKEDLEYDQMSLVEYIDPFTGELVKKNKK